MALPGPPRPHRPNLTSKLVRTPHFPKCQYFIGNMCKWPSQGPPDPNGRNWCGRLTSPNVNISLEMCVNGPPMTRQGFPIVFRKLHQAPRGSTTLHEAPGLRRGRGSASEEREVNFRGEA